MRRLFATWIIAVAFVFTAYSHSPRCVPKTRGQTHHVWVFQRIERIMGAGESCKRGEEDDFSADHSVTTTKCDNGKLVRTKRTWSMRNDGVDDWITIGGEEYQLLFGEEGRTMTLRKISTEKPKATVDKDYRRRSD